ncbi:triose-phosphate isomerase [Aldersonia kunmingensis]|uniref:triose-phosphate isomerase n=1 Tax=Aldersonia kunmingensis TaxID=408066 RepID=UPI0008309C39|nr:triose-phosphate isomerase [Aldersonia kunmingensis]
MTVASRKPLLAGNWKMNLNHLEAIALVQKFEYTLPDRYYDNVDVTVLPPFTDLRSVQTLVDADSLKITYGAQDISIHESGAYTGEISGAMLAKLGCTYVVVGHSERRTMHNETDDVVLAKTKAALANGLTPIVCIGEHLEIREPGHHVHHNLNQVRGSLAGLTAEEISKVVVAYEPVWAIGTGLTATPADAQEVCGEVRGELAKLATPEVAAGVRILYGGSANPKNIGELIAEPDVDGALVGGASLKAEDFASMCAIAGQG